MKDITLEYLQTFWNLLTLISPYILLGIFLASILKQIINEKWIENKLGDRSLKSIFRAIFIGIPLPLCSCSVIPFATTLYKSGATKSSTLSFLISTPITGVDSIIATYGVFGWFFTIYRIVTSIIIALFAGVLSLIFDKDIKRSNSYIFNLNSNSPSMISKTAIFTNNKDIKFFKRGFDITKVYNDAIYSIFKDFALSLLIGIALGALLSSFMPSDISIWLSSNLWLNYIIVLIISSLLYICATSSIPLAVALLAIGLTPGAVFILLTAGPATSMITMSVVLSLFGRKSLIIYLFSVLSITLLSGYMLDTIFLDELRDISNIANIEREPSFIGQISAVIMLYLTFKVFKPKKDKSCCSNSCGCGS